MKATAHRLASLMVLNMILPLGLAASAEADDALVNSLGMKFVPVPGTEVLMCIHETRKGDYAKFAREKANLDKSWETVEAYGVPVSEGEDHPVVNINWHDATAFCEWLSQKEGLIYRLPTDREWSYAAGIGSKEAKGTTPERLDEKILKRYPWGSQWPPPNGVGNLADTAGVARIQGMIAVPGYTDGFATTAPVMQFKPNKLGLYDLSGNVWEWCQDWYNETRAERVLRGGSWHYAPLNLLSSDRLYNVPETRDMYRGFRCVVEKRR